MSKKKLIILIVITISFSVLSLIGTTYALFTKTVKGEKTVSITAGTLQIDFEEGNQISLDNIGTFSDEDGRKTEPYRFTIANSGTIASYYNMSLTDEKMIEGKELLDTYYLKYELKDDKGNTKEGRIGELYQFVTNQKLEVEDSITYELRLWLDKDTPNSEQNKGYQSKIVVNGSQMKMESTVTFTYKDKVYQEISKDNVVTISNLELDSDSGAKVLVCNNGASVQYEDNIVTIKNITRDTTCSTDTSLEEVSTKIDNSYNNIVLIKDESYTDEQFTFSNKKGIIDLNGHVITFSPQNITGASIKFIGNSDMVLESSKNGGGIILDLERTHDNNIIYVMGNANLTITSGYYGSNTIARFNSAIEVANNSKEERSVLNIQGKKADNCTSSIEDYHTGLCIYSNNSAAVKNNGGSENGIINIYEGSLVSNNYAYLTDARGGETNIYGGYFKGTNYSIAADAGSNYANTIVNICGGEFNSPKDIYNGTKIVLIYYRNGINWKNGTTPIIEGNYKNNVILKSNLVCK